MPLPERSVLLVFPNIKNTPPSLYNNIKQASFHPFQLRVWMSATHKFVRILFYYPPSTRLTALLVSNGRPLTAAAQSRASHISIAHDAMTSSSNVQETRGTKNLIWKEKPKADVQTSASVTANDGNSIYSGSANDFRGAKSAVQASSVNIASNVSANLIAGRAQPVQIFRPVESSVDGIGSTTDSKLSGSKTSVGGRASIGPDSSRNLAIGKGQTGQKTLWVAKGYATHSGNNNGEQGKPSLIATGGSSSSSSIGAAQVGVKSLSATFGPNVDTVLNRNQMVEEEQSLKGPIVGDFVVDKRAFARSQIRATFYPKFENEKSDQEIRTKMIEMVSNGKGNLEVSLKHSGSLFMYAGHEGGAYAKNSYGNMYTAVGVFVLSRMLQETWGAQAARKQKELNDFLQNNHMCISMELVTAVLGDHGQRPLQDYVVVTAVTELGAGKPRFYSTADIISFCRNWRLPTNSVWLFSTRKSVASFFLAYDALSEEGTASTVCKAMDEIADISVPGTKDHVEVQGEILEGLVARIVSSESVMHLNKVLEEVPPPPIPEVSCELGQGLREICSANKSSEQQRIKALLRSAGTAMCPDYTDWFGSGASDVMAKSSGRSLVMKFIQSHPADYATLKLQEMVRLMTQKKFPADFKCRYNFRKFPYASSNNVHFKMVIHIYNDSGFRRYQKEMREHPGLWPLYRGFFVDVNLFKVSEEKASQMSEDKSLLINHVESSFGARMFEHDDLADEAENLMIKLKFLTYKLRTFLIRNGISPLFKNGPAAYKEYYLRQMKIWGTSHAKIKELSKLLDEWAVYIRRKYGNRQLSSATYLSEAEPFLEQYARRSPQNQALIGSAGTLIKTEDFLVVSQGDLVEEEEFVLKDEKLPLATDTHIDKVSKPQGMIVFFPGIPGCAKSALCRELVNAPGGLGDDRPMHSLMGDLIKGKYWQKVLEERKKKPYEITLADKNAPNEEVWKQIEDMSRSTKAIAVPVVPDSQGTDTNPFDLDALTVFMFRVLQRVNHPGSLDKNSKNAGYVLLMFYNLYEGKTRSDFETELHERFGLLVKMPLLKSDRDPLPDSIKGILNEGLSLYNLHYNRHGRMDCAKGSYAKEWSRWEQRLREILFANADYINAIQVPFEHAVKHVLEDLRAIAKGDYEVVATEKHKLGTIVFAAVSLVTDETKALLDKIADLDSRAKIFIEEKNVKNTLNSAHVTLAHKRAHGVTAVATFGVFRGQQVPVEFTAILFSDKLAALETHLGCIGNEKISSKNEWPHLTIWTGAGATPKEANILPRLVSEGRAIRIDFKEPFTLTGTVDFF